MKPKDTKITKYGAPASSRHYGSRTSSPRLGRQVGGLRSLIPARCLRSLFIFSVLCVFVFLQCGGRKSITIGSKNFSEQVLLGEMLAQQIENSCNVRVQRKLNLGGTFICHKALTAGQIDAYVEYTGTALTAILKLPPANNPGEVYRKVKEAYLRDLNLEWMNPLGFNNTFAIIIRSADARRLNIDTISEAAQFTPKWRAAFGYEFMQRKDGFPGLAAAYGLRFSQAPRIMDLMLTYKAVADKQVDLIAGNSTDGNISKLDLFVLKDDRSYFPPYEAAPVVRSAALREHPCMRQALERLGNTINDDQMRNLNYQVDVEHKDVKQVASDFLKRK